jgi:16S rRNA (adenine1518-N6/adenine1519-N6)-dimethyltransferase
MHRRRPKLGQHFLVSAPIRERIARALPLRRDDLVIEIGAGRGAMTELLAERARRVLAIELDGALAENLRQKLAPIPAIDVIPADILAADISRICRSNSVEECFVFGNLPYYITSPILHHLLDFRTWIRGMALLMQREVADRITAKPGSRDYGYLSVFTQLFSQPRVLFSVPPGAFSPPPKVHSTLVEFGMTPRFPEWSAEHASKFAAFVKLCFAQKRKSLLNNLSGNFPRGRIEEALRSFQLHPKMRAEQLTLDRLATLHAKLEGDTNAPR